MQITASELKFLQQLIQQPGDRSVSAVALRLLEGMGIGRRKGQRLVYAERDIELAKAALLSRGLSLEAFSPEDRAAASNRPGISEKSGGTANPHADSVAYRWIVDGRSMDIGYNVAKSEEVADLAANYVLSVENFETFCKLPAYGWLMKMLTARGKVLAIFRGDNIYSTSDAKRTMEKLHLPKLGFHDFDPAGLCMSARLDDLVAHICPPLDVLAQATKAGKRSDLYFEQFAQCRDVLDSCDKANIPVLWSLMKNIQKGLPQEWMQNIG